MRSGLACAAVLFLCLCAVALGGCTNPFLGILGQPGSSSSTAVLVSSTALSGTSWRLVQLTEGEQTHPLVPTAPITLHFQQNDAAYIGSSGCNYYNGAYSVSGHRLNLTFQSVTQKGCVGPIMSQEVAYLNAMRQVRGYLIHGKTLTLKDGQGNAILVFTAA